MELFRRTARRQGARRGRVKGASMPVRFRLAPMLALAALAFATPACAQGLFDMIFNGDRYAPRPQRNYSPPGHAYADPSNPSEEHFRPQIGAGSFSSPAVRVRGTEVPV